MLKIDHNSPRYPLVPKYAEEQKVRDRCNNDIVLQQSRSAMKADVFIRRENGQQVVVKDYSSSPFLIRVTIGRWLVRREMSALQRLARHTAVPRLIGKYGNFGFSMELVNGKKTSPKALQEDEKLVNQIDSHIKQMHQLGVTHNDIRKSNLLIDQKKNVYVIDFASAVVRSHSLFSPLPLLYLVTKFSERIKVVKLKQTYAPATLAPADLKLLKYVGISKRISRFWKAYVYGTLKLLGGRKTS